MAEAQKEAGALGVGVAEASDFSALLNKEFRPKSDQANINRAWQAIRKHPQEIGRGHKEVTVRVDRNSNADGIDDADFSQIHFHIQWSLFAEKLYHRAIVLAAHSVEQDSICELQFFLESIQPRQIHHG